MKDFQYIANTFRYFSILWYNWSPNLKKIEIISLFKQNQTIIDKPTLLYSGVKTNFQSNGPLAKFLTSIRRQDTNAAGLGLAAVTSLGEYFWHLVYKIVTKNLENGLFDLVWKRCKVQN